MHVTTVCGTAENLQRYISFKISLRSLKVQQQNDDSCFMKRVHFSTSRHHYDINNGRALAVLRNGTN